MSARNTLTPELRAEVLRLEDDLRARVASIPEVQDAWGAEYDAARAAERTAAAWEAWVDERVTLAAVAWVLTTVFVRFCEDNALVKPVWISGPRHREAIDAQQQFLRETARTSADVTDREWLLQAVDYLKSLPATAGLVDDTSPMWLVTPSGDAATRLLNFWRERDESGALIRDLRDSDLDTRFLGDLYQEISEDAKKRYALLQTPVFVEEFILDRTLEPALNERPLEGFKMIDPTCGSGHFLLGGFQRLLDRWHKHTPGLDERERVQAALDSVYGVDINPFAVAIARFRLTVRALSACGLVNLEDAPAFKYHLAAGDSLLHGHDQAEFDLGAAFSADRVASNFAYATENLSALRTILRSGQYDTVVGNPPYIQVKDPALNKLYRGLYTSCHRQYALTVPFMERFFGLARSGSAAGWVGQITSNSFMKREFGGPLVERFLPTKDLRFVINSEGAWMPGHNMDGTPTTIIVGRNRTPTTESIRVVLSNNLREGKEHVDGSGPYWSDLVTNLDNPGFSSQWLSVADFQRKRLGSHPWVLSGGGATELLDAIKGRRLPLISLASDIGYVGLTRCDDAYFGPRGTWQRKGVKEEFVIPMVQGTNIREFRVADPVDSLFPYNHSLKAEPDDAVVRILWPFKQDLIRRREPNGSQLEIGLTWFEWSRFLRKRYQSAALVAFPEIATHNHVVLSTGGRVFNQTAPIIVMPDGSTDVPGVFGLLSSSTVCFWLKQTCKEKGGAADVTWLRTYQFNSTSVGNLPVPRDLPTQVGASLASLSSELQEALAPFPLDVCPTRPKLEDARTTFENVVSRLVAEQEELDWAVYAAYGLLGDGLRYHELDRPPLAPGERAFEIALARGLAAGSGDATWFERGGIHPVVDLPSTWPGQYKDVVERRIAAIKSDPFLSLLERPEHKRRWVLPSWNDHQSSELEKWILRRLEGHDFWFDRQGRPTPTSIAVLADDATRDRDLVAAIELLEGRPDASVAAVLARLIPTEAVPFLASYRYKESGIRKRSDWEATWDLQRREDTGHYRATPKNVGGDGPIPVPPKYVPADFVRPEWWAQRGKLDLPKERFILYPAAGREGEATPVIGWAGWDHAQQALALATLIQSGEQQGWSEERLTPLVAGLSEVLPWVEQWYTDPDPLYGGSSPAEFFSGLLDNYMAKLGATRESLADWRPPAARRGRRAKS